MKPFRYISLLPLFFFSMGGAVQAASSPAVRILEKIPVQHGGRIKPFQSFAREASLAITGKNNFEGIPAAELLWRWMADPEKWNAQPMLPVSYRPLQQEFSLMLVRARISPEIVLNHGPFLEKVEAAIKRREKKERLLIPDQKRVELYERALFFRAIAS